jgi:hypothetical protein
LHLRLLLAQHFLALADVFCRNAAHVTEAAIAK